MNSNINRDSKKISLGNLIAIFGIMITLLTTGIQLIYFFIKMVESYTMEFLILKSFKMTVKHGSLSIFFLYYFAFSFCFI